MTLTRPRQWLLALALGALNILATSADTAERTAEPNVADWQPVAEALGRPGTLLPGDIYRVGLPRTDLTVTVQGVQVKAGFALGSYAAFKKMGASAMVMGDLVLLDAEVSPVMSGLQERGLTVTALHNHLINMSPHVMYMHYTGHGTPADLARSLRAALSVTGTPFGPPAQGTGGELGIPKSQVDTIIGRTGTINNGVLQFSVPRAERITEGKVLLLPGMGVATVINLQPTGDGKAATTGDFVLVAGEVNPVARALQTHGIQVTAIHQHALADNPRLFYMHFWANDDAVQLARGLRTALDLTKSSKEKPQ
jgi:Domain of Unknown Function (DUF1259)